MGSRIVAGALSAALVLSSAPRTGDASRAHADVSPSPGASPVAKASAGIDEISSRLFRDGKIVGLVVGIVDHGQQKVLSFGEVEKGSGRKSDASTIFDLGAVTTTFTATILAAFAERGLVRLDDPLQKYAPAGVTVPTEQGQPITLLELATHTSGLPTVRKMLAQRGGSGPRHARREKTVFADLDGIQLVRPPGQQFAPTTLDYVLLADTLARLAKLDYPALLASEVCSRLGINDTGVEVGAAQQPRHAQGYAPDGTPVPHLRSLPLSLGATDLHSTLDDLLKFLRWNMGLIDQSRSLLPILQQKRHETSRPGIDIGLAWRIKDDGRHPVVFSNGIRPGFRAVIAFVPDTQTGVVILANTSVGGVEQAAMRILSALNGLPEGAPLPAESTGGEDDTDEP